MKKSDLKFNELIKETKKRIRESTVERSNIIDELYSDRSRIIYCSSFRRLQQKAQVFSLEPNASVRTRLTHSLEVSDIGRTLANAIAYQLRDKGLLSDGNIPIVVSIVENACLLHDIGNPPFGHFGEAAIKDWANNSEFLKKYKKNKRCNKKLCEKLFADFNEFDGNPQGFRTVTKLYNDVDENGLNLTYSTLLSILKYSRSSGEKIKIQNDITKKAGYFQSEKELVERIYSECKLDIHHRYPFTYIMEAADDIAYCMSDIADGIEKGIFSEKDFVEHFKDIWKKSYGDKDLPVEILNFCKEGNKCKGFNIDFSVPWSKKAIQEAVDKFMKNICSIYSGTAGSLISEDSEIGKILKTIKTVSKKYLYSSFEAESIELTGFAVITGILKRYERLLKLSSDDFKEIVNHESKGKDYEQRLFNLLGDRYVNAYIYAENKLKNDSEYSIRELWLRIHLIIDHISGMTDEFALETYQMLEGIQLYAS